MKNDLIELKMRPYVKYIVLKIDPFESEIIDEDNFGIEEEFEIMKFKKKYLHRDDCLIVKVEM